MKKATIARILPLLFGVLVSGASAYAAGPSTVNLGTASNFVILAGSTVTNTGSSVILNGDLGLSPGTAVTGFPPATLSGTQHVADATAFGAKADLVNAYNDAAGRPSTVIGSQLGGTVITPGVYSSADGTFSVTGTLTLDAQGDSNAVFIFKTSTSLITAGASNVVLTGGAQAGNVFWQVGSSATLGTNSTFKGNILAMTSITLTTSTNVEGRLLARNGAVTLDGNHVTKPALVAAVATPVPATVTTTTVVNTSTTATPAPTPFVTPLPTPLVIVVPATTTTVVTTTTSGTPKLPNAGMDPDENKSKAPMNALILVVVAASLFTLYTLQKKHIV